MNPATLLVTLLVAQTGVQNRDYIACYESGDWLSCVLGPYVGLLGTSLFGALLVGPTTFALWIYSGSIVIPAVLLSVLMGFVFSGIPPQVSIVMYAFVTGGLALAYRSFVFTRSST